jgi:integrase
MSRSSALNCLAKQRGTPKTHERRSVPFRAVLADELAALMIGKDRNALVFTDMRGGVLRNSNWRARVFEPAVTACQQAYDTFPTISPHDLRHTAASLAVSAGANVKAVQRMLGHPKQHDAGRVCGPVR